MIYDVIVVGGGTAGAVAAIAAGRSGLNTLIIESNGYLGGTSTGAAVSPMMSNLHDDYISDLNEEIMSRLKETNDGFGNWFNPEMLKIVLEDMAISAKVDMRYYTNAVNVNMQENTIKSVCIHSKSGFEEIQGKIIIDASGDADIAEYAGVKTLKGNSKGINQPVSLRFIMSNVDVKEFSDYVKSLGQTTELDTNEFHTAHTSDGNFPLKPVFEQAIKDGYITEDDAKYFQCFSLPGREKDLTFNCPEIFESIDGTDSEQLTKAQIIGKQKILRYVKFLKTLPGFQNSYLSQIAPMVGIRESRRIVGKYVLTAEDILAYRKFENKIVSSNYPVDIHNADEKEIANIEALRKNISEKEKYYDLPVDIMLCNEVDNLLVVGRCVSTDFVAQSAVRIQNTCRAMGEVASYMASIALKGNKTIKDVDGKKLNNLLKTKGFS